MVSIGVLWLNMSVALVLHVWNYTGSDLNGTQKAILARMAFYASSRHSAVYPSVQTLCEQTSFKRSTVEKSLSYLRKKKFLIVAQDLPGKSCHYLISVDRLKNPELIDEQRKLTKNDENKRKRKRLNKTI